MIRLSPLLLLLLGCEPPAAPTPAKVERPIAVGVKELFEAYRFNPEIADAAYTDKKIQVRLTDYTILPLGIGVNFGMPSAPPIIFFVVGEPPKDNKATITITGVCRGRVNDRQVRAAGVTWYLLIDQCSWTAR